MVDAKIVASAVITLVILRYESVCVYSQYNGVIRQTLTLFSYFCCGYSVIL